jgi:ubiquinone/menaquinone biosynthesis C-methylase UbiE
MSSETNLSAEKKMPDAHFLPEVLACPHCQTDLQTAGKQPVCHTCGITFFHNGGFIDLIADPALKTQLQEAHYDAEHGLNDQRRLTTWERWQRLLDTFVASRQRVLEIGAGSGHLTWGLLQRSDFSEVHVSDISPAFLQITLSQHDPGNRAAFYYLCDANCLPFRHDTMDCILGNSVLHHFVDYEKTLRAAFNTLKPGGKAIFFEPVQQGKAFIALLARLIWQVDSNADKPLFTPDHYRKLQHISAHIGNQERSRATVTDMQRLLALEDKYIFDIPALDTLAQQIGFCALHVENQQPMDHSYWLYVAHQLALTGFDREKLKHYQYLFDSIRDTLGKMIGHTMHSPMVYLVFEKPG